MPVAHALESFVQGVLDHPANATALAAIEPATLARELWHEVRVVLLRLLYARALERLPESGLPEDAVWQANYTVSGSALGTEASLRGLFALLAGERAEPALAFTPPGGRLFARGALARLEGLAWGDAGVAALAGALGESDRPAASAGIDPAAEPARVYEALLAYEPGIAAGPMVRLRRGELEAVVPRARAPVGVERATGSLPARRTPRAAIVAIEEIPPGRFYLRASLSRKSAGAYYTPPEFVRFLVEETLGPAVRRASPPDAPDPSKILEISVLDPAMGAGVFLVEATRFLGDAVADAAERATAANPPDRATARWLAASRCVYGVDLDPLAVGLARISIGLAAYVPGRPLPTPEAKLIAGDSLTAPTTTQAATLPASGAPLHVPLPADPAARRLLSAVWSGAVLAGASAADDREYGELARTLADPAAARSPRLATHAARGASGVPFELAFPQVFAPRAAGEPAGFTAVLGNPPWERLLPAEKEFFAEFDLSIVAAPTKRERAAAAARLCQVPAIAAELARYRESFAAMERLARRAYPAQRAVLRGRTTIGKPDAFRLFAERVPDLLAEGGAAGLVVPSAFHANEGATGVRRLWLERMAWDQCLSFTNRAGLFDIHRSFKFALVVARRSAAGTHAVSCAFHRTGPAALAPDAARLSYDRAFLDRAGGPHLAFPELRTPADVALARRCWSAGPSFREACRVDKIRVGREVNMTDDAPAFVPARELSAELMPLHEGKTFHQYTDRWDAPRYALPAARVAGKPGWLAAARHFRLAVRTIASSTNERTAIAALMPPGTLFGNSAAVERAPGERPAAHALALLAVINAHPFDWTLRQLNAANVNLFILERCPVPPLDGPARAFLAHGALRLSASHAGYAPLWREQLGRRWTARDALAGSERAAVRAALDAVVAHAYGLARADYAHLLRAFSHKSDPDTPARCLAAFDELARTGRAAYLTRHDPYAGVALPDALPVPTAPFLPEPASAAVCAARMR